MPLRSLSAQRFFVLLLMLMLAQTIALASTPEKRVDSLKNLLSTSPAGQPTADTVTVNRLNKLAADYFQSNPDSTFYYGQKSIALSRKINYEAGLASALLQTGHVNYFKGRSEEAKKNFDEAIVIFKKTKDFAGLSACYNEYSRMYNLLADYDQALKYLALATEINTHIHDEKALVSNYKNTGVVYYSRGDLSKALDYYYKGLYIAVKNQYKIPSAELYNNIGLVLQTMEVYPKALEHFQKALKLFEGTNNIQAIGTVKENIGEVLLAQKAYDKAIVYLSGSLKIAKKQEDVDGLCSLYSDLGVCYANKGVADKAVKLLDTAVQISKKHQYIYNQAYALIGLATAYNLQKDYNNAFKYASEGQTLAIDLGNLSVRANAALQLSKALSGLSKYEDAYKYLSRYNDLKAKLKDNESIQKLTSYNYELNFSAKERQLRDEQHEKNLLYQRKIDNQWSLIVIAFVVIVAMVVILVNYYKQKRKQQEINAKLELKNREVLEQKISLDEQTQSLNDLNILKDRLISILAHDLRAPLSTLRGVFDLLQDETITHEEMLAMIPDVLKNLEYTSDFLDTLLFWINSQLATFQRSATRFSIKDVLKHEIDTHVAAAHKKGVTLSDHVSSDVFAIADPNTVRIVIRNLVTNAIKFTGSGDRIHIDTQTDGDNVIFSVTDTGVGMSQEQANKLFKSKVDSTTGTNNEQGTGMGLLFCKDLIEKSNGRIWVESQVGIGTTMSFTLPAILGVPKEPALI